MPTGYGQQQPGSPMNDGLMMKFRMIAKPNCDYIEVDQLAEAYGDLNFPARSARLLMLATTDKAYIDMQSFPNFDFYVTAFHTQFSSFKSATLTAAQTAQALAGLNFPVQPAQVQTLIGKYGANGSVDFGQFMAICSYLLLCGKIMQKFDRNGQGRLSIDYNGLVNLGIWFA